MEALSILVGCLTAVVPIVVGYAAIATIDYRVSGVRRRAALQSAAWGLGLSIGWGISLAALILWTHLVLPNGASIPGVPILALTLAPVVVGVLPAGLLLLLASGPSSGTPDRVPSWREWVERW